MVYLLHPGAALVEPYRQGQLDALCGLYALINALRILHAPNRPLSRRRCKMLFATGMDALIAKKKSRDAARSGMTVARQWKLAEVLFTSAALHGYPRAELYPALQRIAKVEEIDEALEELIAGGAVLLVGFDGRLSHHSVIVGVTDARVILFDSDGMRFVKKPSLRLKGSRHGSLSVDSLVPIGAV